MRHHPLPATQARPVLVCAPPNFQCLFLPTQPLKASSQILTKFHTRRNAMLCTGDRSGSGPPWFVQPREGSTLPSVTDLPHRQRCNKTVSLPRRPKMGGLVKGQAL